jgi:hypothetical protein
MFPLVGLSQNPGANQETHLEFHRHGSLVSSPIAVFDFHGFATLSSPLVSSHVLQSRLLFSPLLLDLQKTVFTEKNKKQET